MALDNQESAPSAAVEVVVPDRSIPPAPEVVSATAAAVKPWSGSDRDGRKRLRPSSSSCAAPTRAKSGSSWAGLCPAAARDYTDSFVEPGAEYWYRVVAISPNGNRSEPSAAVWVRIGAPPIPTPPSPKAELVLKPSPHVRVLFAPAPQGLEAVLERKLPAEKDWVILSAVSRGGEVVDADPPAGGKAEYRIAYRTRSGIYGPASPAVFIQR